jgi:protease-4
MSADTSPAAAPNPTSSTIVIRQSDGGLFWRLLAYFGWTAFAIAAFFALAQFLSFQSYFDNSHGITEKYHSGAKFASHKVAIIAVEGIIADADGYVKGQIDSVRDDEDVKAVVVRIDSPGGTVTASDYMWHHLKKLREERKIPLVVSMGGIAASGGYYVAMAVGDQPQSIYAEPTTTTGSIGVMFPHYDFSGLLQRFDVKDDSLVTHPRKELASMTKPMTEDHRALLQGYIEESFVRFKEVVQSGRPKFKQDPEALNKIATGEIFSANKARQHGLVDEIGFVEDAIARAISLAGLSADDVRVVRYQPPVTLFDIGMLASTPAGGSSARQFDAFLEFGTPRPYYLASTIPPLLSSHARLLSPASR